MKKELNIKELHQIALNEALKIHENDFETLVGIDKHGNIYRTKGKNDYVIATKSIEEKSVIVLHNHPDEAHAMTTFSGHDVLIFLTGKAREIMVCGYGNIHTLCRKQGYKYHPEKLEHKLTKLYNTIDNKYKKIADEKIDKTKGKDIDKEIVGITHEWLRNRAGEYNTEAAKVFAEKGLSFKKRKL